ARANYYPQINWQSSYSRNYSRSSSTSLLSPKNPYNDYESNVSLNQNIYDFNRTSLQVQIAKLGRDSSAEDLANTLELVALNVKLAYYTLLRAEKARAIAAEVVEQFQQHLNQAQGFFDVGRVPKSDVTKAEVDLSTARINLLTANNDLQNARVGLNVAMGLTDAPFYEIEDNLALSPQEMSFEEILGDAYQRRPDLLSLRKKTEAQERTVDLSKKGYYPTLSGSAAYGFGGQDFPLQNGWNVGAAVNVPIFSGFSTRYQIDQAKANLTIQKANEEALRQSIYMDVKQAYLNLQAAREKIGAADLAVKQATENYDLANGRYNAGVGSPIELTDALVSLNNAKTAYVGALYDYKIAQANLEKAMGTNK
ncbi:MAG: TolC family protein, partial [Smithellaceae bacterium]|nr:TolC family protein [Smithellaceae bacterium]